MQRTGLRAAADAERSATKAQSKGAAARDGADTSLFVCSAPDTVDKADPRAAYDGRKGAILRAVCATDGKTPADLRLDAPPGWSFAGGAQGQLNSHP